tara:strand:+ start:444 stop:983 length:540 start_codon:yes stop_codon:yes gene_type:complete
MSDEIQELIARHNHIVAGIEQHGMIESHRQRITGALNSMAEEFENLLSVQEAQLDYYKNDLDKIRAMVDAKEDQSTVEAVKAMTQPEDVKDVHTEHCCYRHGCKYGKDDCSVETGEKEQSFPCEQCSEEAADPKRSALQSFVDDFETDFMVDGEIVDDPDGRWGRLTALYNEAKAALDD